MMHANSAAAVEFLEEFAFVRVKHFSVEQLWVQEGTH